MSTSEIIFASLTLTFTAVCAFGIIGGALWFIFKLKNKVDIVVKKTGIISETVENLLMIQAPHLLDNYRKATALLYENPQPPPDRDMLLAKLESGTLSLEEVYRLEEIFKWEEAEAIRKNQQKAVLAVGGMLLLLYIFAKKK